MTERHPSWGTTDAEALTALLETYGPPDPRILDVTGNKGRIWKDLWYARAVHRMDLDPGVAPDSVGDFTKPETWPQGRWTVVVFDPPHASEVGKKSRLRQPFATAGFENVTELFPLFLSAAASATPNALLIVKLADQKHRNKQQWQVDEFKFTARSLGWEKLDEFIRVRGSKTQQGNDPKWKNVLCLRKLHSTYLAYRRAA